MYVCLYRKKKQYVFRMRESERSMISWVRVSYNFNNSLAQYRMLPALSR